MSYRKIPRKYKQRAENDASEASKIEDKIVSILSEYMDGFIVMGFTQDKGIPILLQQSNDVKTHMALNDIFLRNFVKLKDEEYSEEPYTLFTDE